MDAQTQNRLPAPAGWGVAREVEDVPPRRDARRCPVCRAWGFRVYATNRRQGVRYLTCRACGHLGKAAMPGGGGGGRGGAADEAAP